MDEKQFKSVNEALLCVKRDDSYNYLDLTKPSFDEEDDVLECADGYRLCGTPTVQNLTAQDLENMFCIPNSGECPITDIAFAVNSEMTD